MNKFKLILKGILLWTTAFVTMFLIAGADSICDNEYFFQTFIAAVVMIFCCYKLISEEEFEVLSLHKWFNKVIKRENYADNNCNFYRQEDVIKAVEILGNRVKNLFDQNTKLYDYGNSRNLCTNGKLCLEDGVMCDPEEFWRYRQGSEWDDGWEIIPNPERSVG